MRSFTWQRQRRFRFCLPPQHRVNLKFSSLVYALLDQSTFLPYLSRPILHTLRPLTCILGIRSPMHLSIPMPQIIKKSPMIMTASRPIVLPLPTPLIVHIATNILFIPKLPFPLPMPQSVSKLPLVDGAVCPSVDPLALRLTICITAFVAVAVGEQLATNTMFVTSPDVSSVARKGRLNFAYSFRTVEFPTPSVVIFTSPPGPLSMFQSSQKTAYVRVPIGPKENRRVILRFIIEKLSNVDISSDVLEPSPMSTTILKLALIKPSGLTEANQQPIPMLGFIAALSEVRPSRTAPYLHLPVLHLRPGKFLQLRMRITSKRIRMVFSLEELLDDCSLLCQEVTIEKYLVVWLILRCGHSSIIEGR